MTNLWSGFTGKPLASVEEFIKKNNVQHAAYAQQVHGTKLYEAHQAGIQKVEGYDAFVTTEKDVCLIVKMADCMPLLISAPGLIAAIHAGRVGTEKEITAKTIATLKSKYRVDPAKMQVKVGPAICVRCHQIDREKDIHYDLWENNLQQLVKAGVLEKNIEHLNICTFEDQRYYSFRRDNTELRNVAYIMMPGAYKAQ